MGKLGLLVLCLAVSSLLVCLDNIKIKRNYDNLKTDHERLKNDIKLLQQENYYLKQYSRFDYDTER